MMNDQERMDDLLAYAVAHRAALEEIVAKLIPARERRQLATNACAAFEVLDELKEATARSHLLSQKAMGEIERIFHAPPSPPELTELER